MKIAWDEHKRISNLDKHGLDFADVVEVDWSTAIIEPTYNNRFKAIARLQDKTTVIIYASLGSEAISIISFRYASPRDAMPVHVKGDFTMPIKRKTIKEFQEGRGYSREDWDAVDSPPLTEEEISRMRPAKEVMPEAFFEAMREARRARGRPRIDASKQAVTLRLDPDIIQSYKNRGKGWRSIMTEDLRKAAGL